MNSELDIAANERLTTTLVWFSHQLIEHYFVFKQLEVKNIEHGLHTKGKGEKSWLKCIKCDPKDLRANGCKEGIVSSLQKVNCEMSFQSKLYLIGVTYSWKCDWLHWRGKPNKRYIVTNCVNLCGSGFWNILWIASGNSQPLKWKVPPSLAKLYN